MIQIKTQKYADCNGPITEWEQFRSYDDLSQTMTEKQFLLRGQKQDAEKVISVLGTANASFETVTWKRTLTQVKPYVDYIVTVS